MTDGWYLETWEVSAGITLSLVYIKRDHIRCMLFNSVSHIVSWQGLKYMPELYSPLVPLSREKARTIRSTWGKPANRLRFCNVGFKVNQGSSGWYLR